MSKRPVVLEVKMTPLDSLSPHPRNYRGHPADQIEHLKASLSEYGWYRNVVICRGDVILAGHGVVEAAKDLGWTEAPCVRLDLDADDPKALKVLALDNYAAHLAEDDDRMLTEMLREIQLTDELLGTGFDEASLAALVMVTRSAAEIRDFDAASEWLGMPEYTGGVLRRGPTAIIEFDDDEQRERFVELVGDLIVVHGTSDGRTRSYRWAETPETARKTPLASLLFEGHDHVDGTAVPDLHSVEGPR